MAKRRKKTNKNVPAKGRLRDMADRLWSLAIRDDWNWKCAVCGKAKCEAHHLIPRQHEATRYELSNGIALCASHHQFDAAISPHQNAAGWLMWLREHHPLRHKWYTETVEDNEHTSFSGTTNPQYFIEVIRSLREYVDESDFVRVVGIKFSDYLQGVH